MGAVTYVTEESVLVQRLVCAVEDEMTFDEIVSTGIFADKVSRQRTMGRTL
jgi:hypothetical protein